LDDLRKKRDDENN